MIYLLFGCCYGFGWLIGLVLFGAAQLYKTIKFLMS